MRISDWSSDVCSSDLLIVTTAEAAAAVTAAVARIASDGWLSAGEKTGLVHSHKAMIENHIALDAKATAIGEAATARTVATDAVNELKAHLTGLTPPWNHTTPDPTATAPTNNNILVTPGQPLQTSQPQNDDRKSQRARCEGNSNRRGGGRADGRNSGGKRTQCLSHRPYPGMERHDDGHPRRRPDDHEPLGHGGAGRRCITGCDTGPRRTGWYTGNRRRRRHRRDGWQAGRIRLETRRHRSGGAGWQRHSRRLVRRSAGRERSTVDVEGKAGTGRHAGRRRDMVDADPSQRR